MDTTSEEREQAGKETAIENARLVKERMTRRSQELRLRSSEGNLQLLDEVEKADLGESSTLEVTPENRMTTRYPVRQAGKAGKDAGRSIENLETVESQHRSF